MAEPGPWGGGGCSLRGGQKGPWGQTGSGPLLQLRDRCTRNRNRQNSELRTVKVDPGRKQPEKGPWPLSRRVTSSKQQLPDRSLSLDLCGGPNSWAAPWRPALLRNTPAVCPAVPSSPVVSWSGPRHSSVLASPWTSWGESPSPSLDRCAWNLLLPSRACSLACTRTLANQQQQPPPLPQSVAW